MAAVPADDSFVKSSKIMIFGATINIMCTAMGGGGIFGNVFAASQLGVIGFIVVALISAVFTFFTIQFLCIASQISQKDSCCALSHHFLGGKKGDLLTKFFITFGNWSYIVNTIQIFADFTQYILAQIDTEVNTFWTSRELAVIIGLFFIYPFVTVKNITHLQYLSGVLILFAFVILMIILVNATKAIVYDEIAASIQLFPANYNFIFRGLPPITWCWSVQFNVLPVYMNLNPLTRMKQMQYVSCWSVCMLFVFYSLFGISSMLIWGNQINDDFITNLSYNNKNYVFYFDRSLSTVTQFFLVIMTFGSIPIFAFEGRTNMHSILVDIYHCFSNCNRSNDTSETIEEDGDFIDGSHETTPLIESTEIQTAEIETESKEETSISRFIIGTILLVSAAAAALFVQDLNWTLGVVGSTYGCYISYFLPTVIYLRTSRCDHTNSTMKKRGFACMAIIIFIYGVAVCALGLTEAFR